MKIRKNNFTKERLDRLDRAIQSHTDKPIKKAKDISKEKLNWSEILKAQYSDSLKYMVESSNPFISKLPKINYEPVKYVVPDNWILIEETNGNKVWKRK